MNPEDIVLSKVRQTLKAIRLSHSYGECKATELMAGEECDCAYQALGLV